MKETAKLMKCLLNYAAVDVAPNARKGNYFLNSVNLHHQLKGYLKNYL